VCVRGKGGFVVGGYRIHLVICLSKGGDWEGYLGSSERCRRASKVAV
jgi:hypothetical protein